MPVILPTRITDRTAVEEAAVKFQKHALRCVPAIRTALAGIMRLSVDKVQTDLLHRGLQHQDWTLIRESLPVLVPNRHVPMKKASAEPGKVGNVQTVPSSIETLTDTLASAFGEAAAYGAAFLPAFDLVDQHAVDYAATRAGRFLSDLEGNALTAARDAVSWGIENGRTVGETARYLSSTMYLPERGQTAVNNYFNGLVDRLQQGDTLVEAARAENANRALSPTKWLDAQNTDTLVERYADRWIDYTAETTARTMTIEASNAGLLDGWKEADANGFLNLATSTLVWYATEDERTCPQCEDLDGTETPADDPNFGDVDLPPAHPDCRCTVVLVTPDGIETEVDQ